MQYDFRRLFYSALRMVIIHRITPFGYPGVNGCLLLTPAFRSLLRPSSSYGSIGIRHRPVFAWPYFYLHFLSPSFFRPFFRLLFKLRIPQDSAIRKSNLHNSSIPAWIIPSFLCNFKHLMTLVIFIWQVGERNKINNNLQSTHCINTFLLERRWSSRTFRYDYLVTTSPPSRSVP